MRTGSKDDSGKAKMPNLSDLAPTPNDSDDTRGRSREAKRSAWSKLTGSLKGKSKAAEGADRELGWVEFKKGAFVFTLCT